MNKTSARDASNMKREATLNKWKSKKINKIIDKIDVAIYRASNRGEYSIKKRFNVPMVCKEEAMQSIKEVYKNRGFGVGCRSVYISCPGSRLRVRHPTKVSIYVSW